MYLFIQIKLLFSQLEYDVFLFNKTWDRVQKNTHSNARDEKFDKQNLWFKKQKKCYS